MAIIYETAAQPNYEEFTEPQTLAVGSTGPVIFEVDNTIPYTLEGVYCIVAQPSTSPTTADDRKSAGLPIISNIYTETDSTYTNIDKIYIDHSAITQTQAGGASGTSAKMRIKLTRRSS